jgi:hypothetical protein
LKRGEQPVDALGKIVRQVVGYIDRKPGGESLRGWAEVGIQDLVIRSQAPEVAHDALGLKTLTDGSRMKPDQREVVAAMRPGPVEKTLSSVPPCSHGPPHLR